MSTSKASAPGLPPFSQVLKSREVEDPVNLWVHRPLAYAFCALVFRLPVTPNMVTFFAILLGLGAAWAWVDGSHVAMITGGILLWSSAIMDGADGILARAKNMQSQFGRALDGMADMIVGLTTVAAAIFHMWQVHHSLILTGVSVVALLATGLQLNLYDFYKELFLRMTRLDRGGESETAEGARELAASAETRARPWYERISVGVYRDYLQQQENITRATNPGALRLLSGVRRSEETAEVYRELNRPPMRFWMAISLAPHSYLFAICGMIDRLDLYVWLRVIGMSLLMLAGIWSQRRATARTLAHFERVGAVDPLP